MQNSNHSRSTHARVTWAFVQVVLRQPCLRTTSPPDSLSAGEPLEIFETERVCVGWQLHVHLDAKIEELGLHGLHACLERNDVHGTSHKPFIVDPRLAGRGRRGV